MLPNLTIILIIFVVSFTIGWGIYFLSNDPHVELDGRMGNFGGLNKDTM
jgi:hypothetical protein